VWFGFAAEKPFLKEKLDEEPLVDCCAADGRDNWSFGAKADKAFTGEIMDSTCAKMGNR
jgi:hypothetical protein